jgi:hypothetical protein
MSKARVPDYLRKAADILETRGWTQHITLDEDGAVDLSGSIALAFGVSESDLCEDMERMAVFVPENKVAFLLAAWGFLEGYVRQYPTSWNDSPSRTKEEVVKMLRGAAAELNATN